MVAINGQVLSNAVAVAAAGDYGMALKSDGAVVAWGATAEPTSVPAGLDNVIAIAGIGSRNLALKRDGTVVGWGDQTPVPNDLTNAVAVAVPSFDLALKTDGKIVCWGEFLERRGFVPVGLSNVVAIAGNFDGIALRRDGTVAEWSFNGPIEIKREPLETTNGKVIRFLARMADYRPIDGLSNVMSIAAGLEYNLAVKSDGTVFGWGDNMSGQATGVQETNCPLKWGPYIDEPTSQGLVTIDGQVLSNVVAVAAGHYMSLALKKDGTIVKWGGNPYDGTTMPAGLSNVVAIEIAGGDRDDLCFAITTNAAVADKFRQR